MANEISTTAQLRVTLSAITVANTSTSKTQNSSASAVNALASVQDVGAAEEAVNLGDIDITNATGADYMLMMRNHDPTNNVTVKVKTGVATYMSCGKMLPGESWGPARMEKLDGSGYGGVYLISSSGTCAVEVVASEAGTPA